MLVMTRLNGLPPARARVSALTYNHDCSCSVAGDESPFWTGVGVVPEYFAFKTKQNKNKNWKRGAGPRRKHIVGRILLPVAHVSIVLTSLYAEYGMPMLHTKLRCTGLLSYTSSVL